MASPIGSSSGTQRLAWEELLPADQEARISAQQKKCGFCAKEGPDSKLCGRCRLVYYCNDKCQKAAWKAHKAVCAPPKKVNVVIRTGSGQEHTLRAKTWKREQLQETHTRRPDFLSTGRRVKPPEPTHEYPVEKGLTQTDPQYLQELLGNTNYAALLPYVRGEKDIAFKVEWMRRAAEEGHVPLMFELISAISDKMRRGATIDAEIEEAMKWSHIGMHCAQLDLACSDDQSAEAAIGVYGEAVVKPLFQLLSPEKRAKFRSSEYRLAQIRKWVPKETDPSPAWIARHGMGVFLGRNSLKPREQWHALRQARHHELTHPG